MRHNLATLNAFAGVMKVMNHSGLRCQAHLILITGFTCVLEYRIGIHDK